VRQLHRCEFIDEANNIVLVGGPGTGKTHIATAIGVQAIEHHHKRVRFFSTVELVNALEQEKAQGAQGRSPIGSSIPISSSSTSSATCRSAPQVEHCSSIC
jgi:replication-associated recombination protein RarA